MNDNNNDYIRIISENTNYFINHMNSYIRLIHSNQMKANKHTNPKLLNYISRKHLASK